MHVVWLQAVRKVEMEPTPVHGQPKPAPGTKPKRNPMDDLKREILIM